MASTCANIRHCLSCKLELLEGAAPNTAWMWNQVMTIRVRLHCQRINKRNNDNVSILVVYWKYDYILFSLLVVSLVMSCAVAFGACSATRAAEFRSSETSRARKRDDLTVLTVFSHIANGKDPAAPALPAGEDMAGATCSDSGFGPRRSAASKKGEQTLQQELSQTFKFTIASLPSSEAASERKRLKVMYPWVCAVPFISLSKPKHGDFLSSKAAARLAKEDCTVLFLPTKFWTWRSCTELWTVNSE